MNAPAEKKKYPRYTSLDRSVDRFDPTAIFGEDILFANWVIDKRLYYIQPETVIGKIKIMGMDERMDLTADVMYRAMRFEQVDDRGIPTGHYMFMLYRDLFPYSTMFVDHAQIEEVIPDWPKGVEFAKDSLGSKITDPKARTLVIDAEQFIKEHGGNPAHKLPKTGGWQSKRERKRALTKSG